MWKSLFDDGEAGGATPKEINIRIVPDLFTPFMGRPLSREILALPLSPPYILGEGFATQELKEEAVQLGIKLSLYVAESMFLMCDDIRSMLWRCHKLWRDAERVLFTDSPVEERLLRVIHHVYLKYIRPKNGVYQIGRKLSQLRLITAIWKNYADGIKNLDFLVFKLRREGSLGRNFSSGVESELKKVEEKLRCVKDVSQANGFVREAIESNIQDLWKSVFDKETKEASSTLKLIKYEILCDLFEPLHNEVAALP